MEAVLLSCYTFLVDNLNIVHILDDMFQNELIDSELYDQLSEEMSHKKANRNLLRHMQKNMGSKELQQFCEILDRSSDDCPVHESCVKELRDAISKVTNIV